MADKRDIGALEARKLRNKYEAVAAECKKLKGYALRFPDNPAWQKLAELAEQELRKIESEVRRNAW